MDFQAIVDGMKAMTCVMSVEKLEGDRYGKVKVVTGNRAYIDSIENPAPGAEMLTDKFVPDSEYTNYLTRDLNFEDYCYRSAVGKNTLSYLRGDGKCRTKLKFTFRKKRSPRRSKGWRSR